MNQRVSSLLLRLLPTQTAYAHCDLPCGVYDPAQARIEAESVLKIVEKIQANVDPDFRSRAILLKEQRAELAKQHLLVLWTDYFTPAHLEIAPNLHDLFWRAAKQASAVKRSVDIVEAQKFLDLIIEVTKVFNATKHTS